jgi:hypothetical protein
MPSVALHSIPSLVASPPPGPDPTRTGWRPCWTKVTKFTAASMPTPPVTPWLAPCSPCIPRSNVFARLDTIGTTCSAPECSPPLPAFRVLHQPLARKSKKAVDFLKGKPILLLKLNERVCIRFSRLPLVCARGFLLDDRSIRCESGIEHKGGSARCRSALTRPHTYWP